MKKTRIIVILVMAICSFWVVQATASQKMGYINVTQVFETTNEGKDILKRLQREHTAKQKEMNTKMKAVEAKAKQFQQQAAMLNDAIKKERLQALAKEERDLQALFMQYQGDINKKKAAALGKFEEKVMKVVQIIAKRDGLDWIFRQEVLLHGPIKMDITNQVVREYDKRYPGKKKGK